MVIKVPELVGDKSDGVLYTDGSTAPVVAVTAFDSLVLPRPIETKVLMPGPKASLLEMHIYKGQRAPLHRFAHDVGYYLVRGSLQVTLGGESYHAGSRDAWTAAPGTEISWEASSDCTLLEWMGPPHMMAGKRLITWGGPPSDTAHIFTRWAEQEEMRMRRVEGGTEFGPPGKDIRQFFKVMIPGPAVGLVWITHLEGKMANHIHYHHFACYLINGKMREKFGGNQEYICHSGDMWATQAGARHYTEALADNELVEWKWPTPLLWRGMIHSWDPRR